MLEYLHKKLLFSVGQLKSSVSVTYSNSIVSFNLILQLHHRTRDLCATEKSVACCCPIQFVSLSKQHVSRLLAAKRNDDDIMLLLSRSARSRGLLRCVVVVQCRTKLGVVFDERIITVLRERLQPSCDIITSGQFDTSHCGEIFPNE